MTGPHLYRAHIQRIEDISKCLLFGSSGTARRTDRIEAFDDAVLAIAITLPVLELRAPQVGPHGNLLAELIKLWPSYLTYGLSFLVIGIYWTRSHFLGKILAKTDHTYNLLNLTFLAAVSLLPFPTRAFVDHVKGDDNSGTAAVLYAVALLVPALVWTVKWFYAVRSQLMDSRIDDRYLQRGERNYALTTASLGLAVIVAFIEWRLGIALAALTTLAYLLPPQSPEYKPGQAPADDVEEADEKLHD